MFTPHFLQYFYYLCIRRARDGYMECLPNLHDTVRVFTSSTFTDTAAERNFLMERVFPVLVDMCRQEGVSFHAVDLRWGEACTACAGVAVWRMTFWFGLGGCVQASAMKPLMTRKLRRYACQRLRSARERVSAQCSSTLARTRFVIHFQEQTSRLAHFVN